MKKKGLLAVLTAVCVVAVAMFALACAPKGGATDKAKDNAEFVSYRKKVVAVLKDNGIFVNDYDGGIRNAKRDGGGTYSIIDGLPTRGKATR